MPTPSKSHWLIAHRGAMTEAPENTRSAFEAAVTYGVDGMEFDVQLTKDDVPVIFHDATLKRICGKAQSVSSHPFKKLAQMDWGGWFAPNFAGEPLMTLKDMLSTYGATRRLLIEIKSHARDRKNNRARRLTDFVLDEIQQMVSPERREDLAILSFDADVLTHAAEKTPNLHYIWNVENAQISRLSRPDLPAYLFGVCASIKGITPGFAQMTLEMGLKLATYSCNNPVQTQKALTLGVDIIMTDDPGWLTAYLASSHIA